MIIRLDISCALYVEHFFPEKLDISYEKYVKQTVHMKYQTLFSQKKKKKSSAVVVIGALRIKFGQ